MVVTKMVKRGWQVIKWRYKVSYTTVLYLLPISWAVLAHGPLKTDPANPF